VYIKQRHEDKFCEIIVISLRFAVYYNLTKRESDKNTTGSNTQSATVTYIYLPISKTATNSQRKRTVNNRQIISYSLHHFPVP